MKKTASRLALAAGFSLVASSAFAADLGGNCCADLEERIAELEATTVRKGNRVMSLQLYGQVNYALVWHDDDTAGSDAEFTIRDNDGRSGTRFGMRGSANLNSDISMGYRIELAVETDSGNADVVNLRLANVYVDSKRLGRLTIGQASTATDGIAEIALGSFFTPFGAEEGSAVSVVASNATPGYDGGRERGLHYTSPVVMGFTVSASYFHDDADPDNDELDINNGWDVALRYAQEFNGIRVAAGVGYREFENYSNPDDFVNSEEFNNQVFAMSGSVLHVPTGLFVNAGYAWRDLQARDIVAADDNIRGADTQGYNVQLGVTRKFTALGTTTVGINYGYNEGIEENIRFEDSHYYGFGITQNIDATATDVYMSFQRYEDTRNVLNAAGTATTGATEERDANVFTAGMRVRF